MANKIGIVLALDGEQEFAQGMKNAQESAKLCDQALKNLNNEYKGNQNSLEALTKKQEALNDKQKAYQRTLDQAKNGQKHAIDNYKKCGQALENLRKDLDKAEDALKDMEKAGDTTSDAYKQQARAVEDLQRAVEKQALEYAKAEGNITKWDTKVSKAEADVRQNSRAVDQNAKYLDEAKNSADHCATSIDKFGKEAKEAGDDASEAGDQVKSFGEKIRDGMAYKVGAMATQAISELGEKAVEAAKYVVEVGSSFEEAMDKVAALSGATGSDLEALSDKAKELGASTRYSATEVADAFGYMALAGWDTQSMLDGIDGVLNLAAASGMDLASASDIVTDQLSAFGLQASDAAKFVDEMAYAQANSNTTTEQLSDAFGNCAANMHAAGQDVETTTSFLEAFANQGIKGSEAGTKLSAIMRDITAKMSDGKIQIGDVAVAVMDANGNFRDLTDIMTDVEAATSGMGDAEKAAALSTTFTSRSVGGLNMILTEGMDKVSGYEEALRNADGTASNMASTMQGNLKGAVTELNSATEGLGIALYKKVQGPLTGAVETATKLISGITDAITPQRTELEAFIKDIEQSNTQVQGLLDSAEREISNAQSKVGELEAYKNTILELQGIINSGGKLDSFQLYQMQNAVAAVKNEIPGIADNFDAVTGKIDLSTTAIENMFAAAEQGAMSMAYQKAMSQELEAVAQARINQAKATAAVTKAENDLADATARNEASADYLAGGYGEFYTEVLNAQAAVDDANKALTEAGKVASEAEESYNLLKDASQELTEEQGQLADEMNGNATATEGARQEHLELEKAQQAEAAAARGAATALEEEAESADEAAQTAKDAAKAQYDSAKEIQSAHEEAAQAITKAYEDAKTAAEKAFEINPFDSWEQNEENGISKFQESLDSQIQGLTNYSNNLQTVSDHVGKEITPEFLQYIQDMGTGGAQVMQELAEALSSGDTGKVETLMNSYVEAMNKQDEIASTMAANKVAMQIGAKELGSTEIEWEGLDNAVNYLQELGGEISEETLSAFQQAEEAAKEAGVKIPNGLVEGIENGDTDPDAAIQHATEILNAALEGSGESLKEIAKGVGANIPEGYDEAIQEGGDAAVEAMNQLLQNVSEATSQAEEAGKTVGETVGNETASGVESKGSDVQSAGETIAGQGAEGAESKSSEYTSAGETLGGSFTEGVSSKQGEATLAGASLAAAAHSGASIGSLYDVGVNLAQGMASGIMSQASSIASAAASLVTSAINAARAAGAIHSPSRKMRDMIGKQLGAGVALGIKQSTGLTADAAEAQMNQTLAALQRWLSKNKKKIGSTGSQWSKDIAYAWQQLASTEINRNFGIASTKTTGSGKNQKTEKKSAEEYYKEIYGAAQQYFRNVQTLYNVSEEDELEYWKKVRAGLKRGTQAWYDASAQIKKISENIKKNQEEVRKSQQEAAQETVEAWVKAVEEYTEAQWEMVESRARELKEANKMSITDELAYWRKIRDTLHKGTDEYKKATQYIRQCKEQIGNFSVASTLMDNYQTYFDVSLRGEVQYWDMVRKQYSAGTEDRIKADQKFIEAKERYNQKLKDIEDDYAQKIADTNQKYTDALANRKDQIMGAYDLFDYFESSSATGEELLFNLQTQAAGYKEWNKSIKDLQDRGILSEDLIEQIINKGPNSIAAIKALLMLNNDQLQDYQKAYDEKEAAANSRAKRDVADVKEEVKEEVASLKRQRAAEIASVKREIGSDILFLAKNVRSIAQDQTSALVGTFTSEGAKVSNSVGSKVSNKIMEASGITNQLIIDAAKAAQAQRAGMPAKIALEFVEQERKLLEKQKAQEAADAEAKAAQTALNKAESAYASALKKQDQAMADLTNAKRERDLIAKDKNATAKQQTQAQEKVTKAETALAKAATAVKDASKSLEAARKTANQKINAANKANSGSMATIIGYASGTKRVGNNGMIWMDEELKSTGPEMIVRRDDNAILTRAKASDAIIPANLADNLFKWGAIDPTQLNTASMASLNLKLAEGYQASVKANNQQITRLDRMLDLMDAFMPYLAERNTVQIQSRDAVTAMSDDISKNMAARARRMR